MQPFLPPAAVASTANVNAKHDKLVPHMATMVAEHGVSLSVSLVLGLSKTLILFTVVQTVYSAYSDSQACTVDAELAWVIPLPVNGPGGCFTSLQLQIFL